MSDQAEVVEFIAERNWGGFFDALVDGSGTLSHRKFSKWTETGSCDEIIKALDKFDVSSDFFGSIEITHYRLN